MSLGRNSGSIGTLRKIKLKCCPRKSAVVQQELHFKTCGHFCVLIHSAAAAEGEAHEGDNEIGTTWQGGEKVKPGLPQKARAY